MDMLFSNNFFSFRLQWNDRYMGMVDGIGENHLGKILMDIRKNYMKKPD
jgi:predicted NAD-dependent protein-ADP-ribosyltransferase YbiA (DUF1768 family)